MHVKIYLGDHSTGKTTQLRALQTHLKEQGIEVPIIVGEHFTTPYFLNQISERALAGAKYFLADDCTQFQIKAVLALAAEEEKSGLPHDLVLHLVRQTKLE